MNNRQKAALNDLQEAMRANPGANMQQCMQGVLGTLQSLGDLRFAIEFECGGCCKTVSAELEDVDFFDFFDGVLLIFGDLKLKECCDKGSKKDILTKAISNQHFGARSAGHKISLITHMANSGYVKAYSYQKYLSSGTSDRRPLLTI